jgi:hypothetical protein
LKTALVQQACGTDKLFTDEEIRKAFIELGQSAEKHGTSYLRETFKPSVTQPCYELEDDCKYEEKAFKPKEFSAYEIFFGEEEEVDEDGVIHSRDY